MSTGWQGTRERGTRWGVEFLRWVLRLGGFGLIRVALVPVAAYYTLTHRSARLASMAYLERLQAFGKEHGLQFNLQPGWRGVYTHFYSFALNLAEKYAIWSGQGLAGSALESEFPELSEQLLSSPGGAVLMVSHLGNFDVAISQATPCTGKHFNILLDHAVTQRVNTERVSESNKNRVTFIDTQHIGPETAVFLRQGEKNGDITVIAADRVSKEGDSNLVVTFLDGQVKLPVGPWVIASLLGCPVYALFVCRDTSGYRLVPYKLVDEVVVSDRARRTEILRDYAQQFADVMERTLLKYPEQWYNFYEYWDE